MEIQVRIGAVGAELLDDLKHRYQAADGVKYTKGRVIERAINETIADWDIANWRQLDQVRPLKQSYNLANGAGRPKLQLSDSGYAQLTELQSRLGDYLGASWATIGSTVNHLVRLALTHHRKENVTVAQVVDSQLRAFTAQNFTEDSKLVLEKFVSELKDKLAENDLLGE